VPAQTPEPQSVPDVHAVPSLQLGEQPPIDLHFPSWQKPEEQSPLAPQELPVPQAGEHAGAAQIPAVQTPEPQS
jgi:hypothetical protein